MIFYFRYGSRASTFPYFYCHLFKLIILGDTCDFIVIDMSKIWNLLVLMNRFYKYWIVVFIKRIILKLFEISSVLQLESYKFNGLVPIWKSGTLLEICIFFITIRVFCYWAYLSEHLSNFVYILILFLMYLISNS